MSLMVACLLLVRKLNIIPESQTMVVKNRRNHKVGMDMRIDEFKF